MNNFLKNPFLETRT